MRDYKVEYTTLGTKPIVILTKEGYKLTLCAETYDEYVKFGRGYALFPELDKDQLEFLQFGTVPQK